jgi:hypothetical protein
MVATRTGNAAAAKKQATSAPMPNQYLIVLTSAHVSMTS